MSDIAQVIRSCANVKIATTTKDFSFSFELLVFVAQNGQLLLLSTSYLINGWNVDSFDRAPSSFLKVMPFV